MRQVAFVNKLNWDYHPGEKPSIEECAEYSYDSILEGNADILARCIYSRKGDIKNRPLSLLEGIKEIGKWCSQKIMVSGYVASCFYHIIKTLHEYPYIP